MKKLVEFCGQDKTGFLPTLHKRVKEYFDNIPNKNTKGNWKMYVKTVIMLSIYWLPFFFLLSNSTTSYLVFYVLWAIMGVGAAGIAMGIVHDAAHGSYSKNKRINEIACWLSCSLGNLIDLWKFQHNFLHHFHTNIPNLDHDIQGSSILRLSTAAPLLKAHRTQHIHAWFQYCFYTLGRFFGEIGSISYYGKISNEKDSPAKYKINTRIQYRKMLIIKSAYLICFIGLPIILTSFNWLIILSGFLLMHFISGFILADVFQLAHVVVGAEQPEPKDGKISTNFEEHEMKTTWNFKAHPIISWYLGGLDNQGVHHLLAHICHIHYPKLAPILKKTAEEFNIPYLCHDSIMQANRSHFMKLKILGRNKITA